MWRRKILSQTRPDFSPFLWVKCAFVAVFVFFSLSAAATSRASDVSQPYNFLIGPVTVRADTTLSTSFNDNINLAKNGRLADILLDPEVGFHGIWQATELNALTFDLGIGYEFYTFHSQYDNVVITPNSQIIFNMSVGDFNISFHDVFSYQQNPLDVAQVTNTTRFPIVNNTAGFDISRNLNEDITATVSYTHFNQWVLDNAFEYLDFAEDSFVPQVSVKLSKTITAGSSLTLSNTVYDQEVQNDNTSISGGPFVEVRLTDALSADAHAGYIVTTYSNTGSNGDSSNINSYYGNVGVTHRINEAFTQSITGGRDFIPGLTSNSTQRTFVTYSLSYQATKEINLSGNFSYENYKDSGGTLSQDSNRLQTGLALNYTLSPHANIGVNYQYTLNDSNLSDDSFYQNLLTTQFHYQF
jgi:hypothetical protein